MSRARNVAANKAVAVDTLSRHPLAWMWSRSAVALLLSVVFVICSGLGVIYVTHINRQLYAQLHDMRRAQDVLESEYERLLLEQSAWSDYSRVEQISGTELEMKPPAEAEIVVVSY